MSLRKTKCWDETVEKMREAFPVGIWMFQTKRILTRVDSDGNITDEKYEIQQGTVALVSYVSFKRTKNPNKMEICAQVLHPVSGSICKISLFIVNPHFIADIRYNPHLHLSLKILS